MRSYKSLPSKCSDKKWKNAEWCSNKCHKWQNFHGIKLGRFFEDGKTMNQSLWNMNQLADSGEIRSVTTIPVRIQKCRLLWNMRFSTESFSAPRNARRFSLLLWQLKTRPKKYDDTHPFLAEFQSKWSLDSRIGIHYKYQKVEFLFLHSIMKQK